jgi:transposase
VCGDNYSLSAGSHAPFGAVITVLYFGRRACYCVDNMFTKRVQVRRGDKTYVYVKLVESYRDNGRVRQRVVANLGREDELKASGQLDLLAASFARLDPPMIGVRRDVGPLLIVADILERLDVKSVIDRHAPQKSRAMLSCGEVICALIANRLCGPSPLYDVAGWATSAAIQERLGIPGMLLNDDRLGRALEQFAPVAEAVRAELAVNAVTEFGIDAGRLHLDLTTLAVAGAYEDSALVAKGWGPNGVKRQVRVLCATNRRGVALYTRPYPGNAAELTCIADTLDALTKTAKPGLVICADSALGHIRNLTAIDRSGLRFVVPLRATTGFKQTFLDTIAPAQMRPLRYVSRREAHLPPNRRTRYTGTIAPLDVTDPITGARVALRVAYIWSSEEATSVADGRQRALTTAETQLAKIRNSLGGRHYKTQQDIDHKIGATVGANIAELITVTTSTDPTTRKPTIGWHRNTNTIEHHARTDGIYALATNLPGNITANKILNIYKDQPLVELRHHDNKGPLRVRPIFLHNDDRIHALISTVGIALLTYGLIETELRNATNDQPLNGLLPEHRPARPTGRNTLAAFQGLGLTYTHQGIQLDRLTTTQRTILTHLNTPITWPEQHPPTCGKRD